MTQTLNLPNRTRAGSGPVAVGDRLPMGLLVNAQGHSVLVPAGPVVLAFHRGTQCAYARAALAGYQRDVVPELRERGVGFVAIGAQGRPSGREQDDLLFPMLGDPGSEYARRLGLDARGEWAQPLPSVVVVDQDGIVRFVDVRPHHTQQCAAEPILRAARELG